MNSYKAIWLPSSTKEVSLVINVDSTQIVYWQYIEVELPSELPTKIQTYNGSLDEEWTINKLIKKFEIPLTTKFKKI